MSNPNDSADFYRTGSEQEHENNNASECSEALEERSAVSLNITLRAEKSLGSTIHFGKL